MRRPLFNNFQLSTGLLLLLLLVDLNACSLSELSCGMMTFWFHVCMLVLTPSSQPPAASNSAHMELRGLLLRNVVSSFFFGGGGAAVTISLLGGLLRDDFLVCTWLHLLFGHLQSLLKVSGSFFHSQLLKKQKSRETVDYLRRVCSPGNAAVCATQNKDYFLILSQ